ncbi:origin recognition complex subunit 2, partial [Dendrothele bispora CBS 962.96]
RIIVQSSFDAYFIHSSTSSSKSQTSNSVFTNLIPPLSQEEYDEAAKSFPASIPSEIVSSESTRTKLFDRFLCELNEGWNVLCYGFGSKRTLLNEFARGRKGHAVVINAFRPDFVFKDVLYAIEQNLPGLAEFQLSSSSSSSTSTSSASYASGSTSTSSIDAQIYRIKSFLRYTFSSSSSSSSSSKSLKPKPRSLYLIIHNIDSPQLRSQKTQSYLSSLALDPHIHIVASIDHVNAPLIWSVDDYVGRKEVEVEGEERTVAEGEGGKAFAWLFHDCTTLLPYDIELSHISPSSIKLLSTQSLSSGFGHGTGMGGGGGTGGAGGAGGISETAALHVLASVTQKAKKLFLWMAKRQMGSMNASGRASNGGGGGGGGGGGKPEGSTNTNANTNANVDPSAHPVTYSLLSERARDEFIATSGTALRALLGEFRDHGLVLGRVSAGGEELLWIPMRKERLEKVVR